MAQELAEIGLTRKELDNMHLYDVPDELKDQRYNVEGHGRAYYYPIKDIPNLSLKYRWLFLANYTKSKTKVSLDVMRNLYAPYKYQDMLAIQTLLDMDRFNQALKIKEEGIKYLNTFVDQVIPALANDSMTSEEVMLYQLASAVVHDFDNSRSDHSLSLFKWDDLEEMRSFKEFVNSHVMDVFRAYVDRVNNDKELQGSDIKPSIYDESYDLPYLHQAEDQDNVKSLIEFLKSLQAEVIVRPKNNSTLSVGWDLANELQRFIYRYASSNKEHLSQNFKDVYGYDLEIDRLIEVENRVYRFFRPGADESLWSGMLGVASDDNDESDSSQSVSQLFPSKADSIVDDSDKPDLSHISAYQIVDDTIEDYSEANSESNTPSAVSASAMSQLSDFATGSSAVALSDGSLEHLLTEKPDDSDSSDDEGPILSF